MGGRSQNSRRNYFLAAVPAAARLRVPFAGLLIKGLLEDFMKKLKVTPMLPAAIAAVLSLVLCMGCGAAAKKAAGTQEEITLTDAELREVIDWKDSTRGAPEQPYWLNSLVLGNDDSVRSAYNISTGDVVRYAVVNNAILEHAQTQAKLLLAQQIDGELKQYVVTAAAQSLDQGQVDIVEKITTATKIDTAGLGVVDYDFWQLVENTDPTNNIKSREYVYYLIYRIPRRNWSDIVIKYFTGVIVQLPDDTAKLNMANALREIAERSRGQE
jgi:hypothetical protein